MFYVYISFHGQLNVSQHSCVV